MRICLTVPSFARDFGGPVAKGRALTAALRELGHEVEFVGCGVEKDAISLPVFAVFHANPIPSRLRPLRDAIRAADIVHVLGYREPVSALASFMAWRRGTPFLLEPFGSYQRWSRSLRIKIAFDLLAHRTVVPGASGIIATSGLEGEKLLVDGLEPSRIFVRPNGMRLPEANDVARGLRDRFQIPPGARLVLSIGRLASTKDFPLLLRSLKSERLSDVFCVIAGPDYKDGTREAILELRTRFDLEGRVFVIDQGLWDAEKVAALNAADCFCLPSASESFGSAALEAAALGLPVVVSTGCGGQEWLPAASSRVFTVGNEVELTKALDEVMAPDVTAAAKRAAPEVREQLDWSRIARSQVEIYESVLASRASSSGSVKR